MWGAIIRLGARYAFFRRWKNTFIFVGGILLCAVTAFLIDAKMYLSAGFIGILAAMVMLFLAWHYAQERRQTRERERQKVEQAAKRAEARNERIGKVKTTAAGVAKGVGNRAAGFANVAKTGLSGARDKVASWRNKPDEEA